MLTESLALRNTSLGVPRSIEREQRRNSDSQGFRLRFTNPPDSSCIAGVTDAAYDSVDKHRGGANLFAPPRVGLPLDAWLMLCCRRWTNGYARGRRCRR